MNREFGTKPSRPQGKVLASAPCSRGDHIRFTLEGGGGAPTLDVRVHTPGGASTRSGLRIPTRQIRSFCDAVLRSKEAICDMGLDQDGEILRKDG